MCWKSILILYAIYFILRVKLYPQLGSTLLNHTVEVCDLNTHNSEICTILLSEFFVCAKHGTQGFTSARQVLHYWARLWFWYFKITSSNSLLIFCHMILPNNFIYSGIIHIAFSISSLFILCQSYLQLMKYTEWNWMEFWTNKKLN